MVTRYELEETSKLPYISRMEVVPNDYGEWVSYEDYDKLESMLTEAEAEINLLRNRLSDVPKSEK